MKESADQFIFNNIFDFFETLKKFNRQRPDYNKYSPKLNTYSAIADALGIGIRNYPIYKKKGYLPSDYNDIYNSLKRNNIIPKKTSTFFVVLVKHIQGELEKDMKMIIDTNKKNSNFYKVSNYYYKEEMYDEYLKNIIKYLNEPSSYEDYISSVLSNISNSSNNIKNQNNKSQYNMKYFTKLPNRSINLIGREVEISQIESYLQNSNIILLVNGLGGIGKTELCKHFLYKSIQNFTYTNIGWIDYLSSFKESLVNQIKYKDLDIFIEDKDNLDIKYNKIFEYLQNIKEYSLLFIDNFDNLNDENLIDITALPFVKIIINSRYKFDELEYIEGFKDIALDFLDMEKLKELFYRYYNGERDNDALEKIIKLSGFHTLTVELLAKTASNKLLSIKELYKNLDELGFNLKEAIDSNIKTRWHNVKDSKSIFEHLLKIFSVSNLNDKEKYILMNLSILPSLEIESENIVKWLNLNSFEDIKMLIDKGWIKQIGFKEILVHPLIRETAIYKLKPDAYNCKNLIESITQFINPYSENNKYNNYILKSKYLPLGDSIIQYIKDETQCISKLLSYLGFLNMKISYFDIALKYQLKAINNQNKILNQNHPDLATSYDILSLIYKELGNLKKALKYQLKAIEIREKVFDKENHPDVAESYNNLAFIYYLLGNLKKALEYGLKAVEIREKVLDKKHHPDLAQSFDNLSLIYQSLGDLEKALEYQLKAVEIREEIFDKEHHPDVAQSYNNLSLLYRELGNLKKALEYQLKALEIIKKVLNKEHPYIAICYNNLSNIYVSQGYLEKSLEYQLKAVEIREKVLDKEHPYLSLSYYNLSNLYRDKGCLEEALEYQLKDIEIIEKIFDKEHHPHVAKAYNNLSNIYKAQGYLEKALEYQLKAVEIREKVLDKNHPYLGLSYNNLSGIYKALEQLDKALDFKLRAIKITKEVFNEDHPSLVTLYSDLEDLKKKIHNETVGSGTKNINLCH